MDYTVGTGTEDRAPQGCAPSAASSAGMATGGSQNGRPKLEDTTRMTFNLFKVKNGLDNGVHFSFVLLVIPYHGSSM
jgi:hypothetical protein